MRVGIDARCIEPQLQGVGRHALNLLLGLSHIESELEFVVFYNNPLPRKVLERSGGVFRRRFQWVKAATKCGMPWEQVEMPWLLRVNKVDLFHDVSGAGVWTAGVPSIITVHELEGLHFSGGASVKRLRKPFRNAKRILAVSEPLAQEVENSFHISRPKIRVVTNAVDPWYFERCSEVEIRAMRERFGLPNGYFLCVTANRPSKNLEFVLQLASRWGGPEPFVFTVDSLAFEGKNAKFLGKVEDVWLRPLYSACTAMISASLYEGFGLPPIECLASGGVPVASSIPVHREILGSVLPEELFFDPLRLDSAERSLRAAQAGGEPLRAAVLEKFRAVRERYSFIETAANAQSVYREALRG